VRGAPRKGEDSMRNLILMALDKANRLTDEQLAEEIAQLESDEGKLRLHDERGRPVPLNGMLVAVFRLVLEERRK
jgi:hypothetical protein